MADPIFRPSNFDVSGFIKGVNEVMEDPDNWEAIVYFHQEIENVVRDFVMPLQPTYDDVTKALKIFENFIMRALNDLGGLPGVVSGFICGAIIKGVEIDDAKMRKLPALYSNLRLKVLGIGLPQPRPPASAP